MKISKTHIWIYREVFETVVQPLTNLKSDQEEINYAVKNALTRWGSELDATTFKKLSVIDAGQRVIRQCRVLNKSNKGLGIPDAAFTFPDLRCPRRSRDKLDPELFFPVDMPVHLKPFKFCKD